MSERVRAAFDAVPRAGFLPSHQRRYADQDRPLPIGHGVTNSQPSTVRSMLELLDARPGERVLDVGAGSGWTTALLAHLVGPDGEVVGVERVPELVDLARERGLPVREATPGVLGWPAGAPYDRILVSADASELPGQLVEQLAPGGVMVVPVRGDMLRVIAGEDGPVVEHHGRYMFVPLMP